jgi:DNA-binding XRE family transcriptional regulator
MMSVDRTRVLRSFGATTTTVRNPTLGRHGRSPWSPRPARGIRGWMRCRRGSEQSRLATRVARHVRVHLSLFTSGTDAARSGCSVRQSAMASHLGIHQSTLSRLEAGDLAGDSNLYIRYLTHLGTEPARWAVDALDVSWNHVEQPQLNHPNLGHITLAERSFARLDAFMAQQSLPSTSRGQAEMLRHELTNAATYLRSLRHSVAYVGGINVGKTPPFASRPGWCCTRKAVSKEP